MLSNFKYYIQNAGSKISKKYVLMDINKIVFIYDLDIK